MNNLYVISKDNPYPLVDNVRPIDYRYDLAGFDDSLPLDLDDPERKEDRWASMPPAIST